MELTKSMMVSASGLKAQSLRMRIISENMANAGTLPGTVNEDPYRRKVVSFANTLNRQNDFHEVKVKRVEIDRSDFGMKYQPGHPGADADGYVRTPNVNTLLEVMDMKQAQRSYDANLNAIETSKTMMMRTVDLLR